MNNKHYYTYIISNKKHGTLYIGVTSDLEGRISEHKLRLIKSFSKRYNLDQLVYYETFEDINYAINREKNLKKWKREWKIKLIEELNPNWDDLAKTLLM